MMPPNLFIKYITLTPTHTLFMKTLKFKHTWPKAKAFALALMVYCGAYLYSFGQDGNAGIEDATSLVLSYFETGTTLMYAIGAVLGLIGAVKVYQKWNSGDQDTSRVAASWFGSCIFLVVVATVLKSFFGI